MIKSVSPGFVMDILHYFLFEIVKFNRKEDFFRSNIQSITKFLYCANGNATTFDILVLSPHKGTLTHHRLLPAVVCFLFTTSNEDDFPDLVAPTYNCQLCCIACAAIVIWKKHAKMRVQR